MLEAIWVRRVLWCSLAAVLLAPPSNAEDASCAEFSREAGRARIASQLDEAAIAYTLDPEHGFGMKLDQEVIDAYNHLVESASTRSSGDLQFGIGAAGAAKSWSRDRLEKSEKELEEAIRLFPVSWRARWLLAKVQQRLGNHGDALSNLWFAFGVFRGEPAIAREAGVEALQTGAFAESICFSKAALAAEPLDGGLYSNLSIAQLLSADVAGAVASAERALELLPGDIAAGRALYFAREVQEGRRRQPQRVEDLR